MDYLESNSTTSNTVENPECDTKTIQNVTQIIEKVHDEIKTTQEDVHHEFKKLSDFFVCTSFGHVNRNVPYEACLLLVL